MRRDLLSKVYESLHLLSLRNFIRVRVGGVGGMLETLEWVVWVACLRGKHESMDHIGGVLT